MQRIAIVGLSSLVTSVAVSAQATQQGDQAVRVERATAGSMQTKLGFGITLNKSSTLSREAITLHDPSLPVELPPSVAVATAYQERGYKYTASYSITPKDSLVAVEVRFLLFDVFGERLSTLRDTEVADMAPGVPFAMQPVWNLWSESEASRYYGSIAFVARVRTKSGRVIEADLKPVLAEAQRFSRKLTAEDLDPTPERRPE